MTALKEGTHNLSSQLQLLQQRQWGTLIQIRLTLIHFTASVICLNHKKVLKSGTSYLTSALTSNGNAGSSCGRKSRPTCTLPKELKDLSNLFGFSTPPFRSEIRNKNGVERIPMQTRGTFLASKTSYPSMKQVTPKQLDAEAYSLNIKM